MKAKEADWFKRMHGVVEPPEESEKHWLNRWEEEQDEKNERLKKFREVTTKKSLSESGNLPR